MFYAVTVYNEFHHIDKIKKVWSQYDSFSIIRDYVNPEFGEHIVGIEPWKIENSIANAVSINERRK